MEESLENTAFSLHLRACYLFRSGHTGNSPILKTCKGDYGTFSGQPCSVSSHSHSSYLIRNPPFLAQAGQLQFCYHLLICQVLLLPDCVSVVLQWTFILSISQLHIEIVSKHIPIIRMAWTAFSGKSGRIYEHLQRCVFSL